MGAISTGDCGRTRSLAGSVPAVTSNHDHRSARIEGAPKGFPAQIGPKQMTKHGQRSVNDGGSATERGRKRRDNETEREGEREGRRKEEEEEEEEEAGNNGNPKTG